jgi:hypothetical protein
LHSVLKIREIQEEMDIKEFRGIDKVDVFGEG